MDRARGGNGGLIWGDCFTAVEQVFASMAKGTARNFPVVREALGHADALYGFKSGFDGQALHLGLKSGGYWPGNAAKGLTNHQSTVFLFDADTGKCRAVVGGNLLTALRTAAAAAVSVAHLARKDARVLGIVGAGHQAAFQSRWLRHSGRSRRSWPGTARRQGSRDCARRPTARGAAVRGRGPLDELGRSRT